MKVIVNALGYQGQSGGAGGAGVFLQYLVSRLAESCKVDVLVPQNSKAFTVRPRDVRFLELPYLTGGTLMHLRDGPTVVLDPFGSLPCDDFPDELGLCVIIHDLMHLEQPYYFVASEKEERSVGFARGLQRADSVIVFSADQARAVRRFFPGARPVVIPHLPYLTLQDAEPRTNLATLPAELDNYVLFPAVKWPHKNHKTVVEAFDAYIRHTGSDLQLVMCGGACAESRFSYLPALDGLSPQILDLGRVDDDLLRALFSQAKAVLFPTLYEGFGIPVLEAAYLGKMVVASRLAVFDEILGPENYRRIDDPLCHFRWMEALADVESSARETYERGAESVRQRIDFNSFHARFNEILTSCAERYRHPAVYPVRDFPVGDRLTSTLAASLDFTDLYGGATHERGPRYPGFGAKPAARFSTIFRSANLPEDSKQCLRAVYAVDAASENSQTTWEFFAWVRLLGDSQLDKLLWSVNDRQVKDLLPDLTDREWHIVRAPIPREGFVDFRGERDGVTERAGFELEIHDASILRSTPLQPPKESPAKRHLTVFVAALSDAAEEILPAIEKVNAALPGDAGSSLTWAVILRGRSTSTYLSSSMLPKNTRLLFVSNLDYTRADATGLVSAYSPIDLLLLLEAGDIASLCNPANLRTLAYALGPAPIRAGATLALDQPGAPFWNSNERGIFLSMGDRVGQPVPMLDPAVVRASLQAEPAKARPRFAVIETDRIKSLSHHGTVTHLFLEGAAALGYEPVLGLNRLAAEAPLDAMTAWAGFSPQVYSPSSANLFAEELSKFVAELALGPDDIIFMHSLSPQIVLGAARFIAANLDLAPHFALRFFSAAEAMRGHKLSYTKILRSIEATKAVRQKMHFFCESLNLIDYYEEHAGRRYPLLFNPEHPILALVRESQWFDPSLGGGKVPILAYFGEAREEKGFDEIPAIVGTLLETESMTSFWFLIQTGSNSDNDTPKITQARKALVALKLKYPDRLRTFDSTETSEQFYFLMKHVTGLIAPYRISSYGKRGTGVVLEALQMGLDVFATAETDLYATFQETGRVVGVPERHSFADAIIAHYAATPPGRSTQSGLAVSALPISQTPKAVCERLLSNCGGGDDSSAIGLGDPVLWVGNDTFGEGNGVVYKAQKLALRKLGRDCLELFVPWPDPHWVGVEEALYDTKIYGFESKYECDGLAWVAVPNYTPQLQSSLREIQEKGVTYPRLRSVNQNFSLPTTFIKAVSNRNSCTTILNYVHLYPVVDSLVRIDDIIIETHDILAYQHAAANNAPVSILDKLDEFADLSQFTKIIAISVAEQHEMSGACPGAAVHWRVPPYMPENTGDRDRNLAAIAMRIQPLLTLGAIPEDVTTPSLSMLSAYYSRTDLQSTFTLDSHFGRMEFFRWWILHALLEIGGNAHLTDAQLRWLVGAVDDEAPFSLHGLLILYLSVRSDLRRAFGGGPDFDVAGVRRWAEHHGERELGLSVDRLVRMMGPKSATLAGRMVHPIGPALDAVVKAGPYSQAQDREKFRELLKRIEQTAQIDLALVGSGHPANIQSIKWFLKEVFLDSFGRTAINVFVVGNVCDHLGEFNHPNIFLLGRCKFIEPVLAAARACPLPVIAGSGSPIKTIPALVINGAITITPHIDRAFGFERYDIPAFSDPREFADDLRKLLFDQPHLETRKLKARAYAADNLTQEGYFAFWRDVMARP